MEKHLCLEDRFLRQLKTNKNQMMNRVKYETMNEPRFHDVKGVVNSGLSSK